MRIPRVLWLLIALSLILSTVRPARASIEEDFQRANESMKSGHVKDAIGLYEEMADRGEESPSISFNRGLAYAERIHLRAEEPGDLGRAAHGFEEAKELGSPEIAKSADDALYVIRSEVAHRRARSGYRGDLNEHAPFTTSVLRLIPPDAWSGIALLSSLTLGISLLWLRSASVATSRRRKVAARLTIASSLALLLITGPLGYAATHDARERREAVVVTSNARPTDDPTIPPKGTDPLPEGARVAVTGSRDAWSQIRFGGKQVWVLSSSLRPLRLRGL